MDKKKERERIYLIRTLTSQMHRRITRRRYGSVTKQDNETDPRDWRRTGIELDLDVLLTLRQADIQEPTSSIHYGEGAAACVNVLRV